MRLFILLLPLLAPVPPYRPAKPVSLVGGWRMTWGSVIYEPVGFAPDGHYDCQGRWEGTWKLSGGVLSVTEWVRDSDAPPVNWTAEITPGKREGRLAGGGVFRLLPIAPRPHE